ncbi:MAG: hypothetical protein E3J72_19425 [Planctomycetota bacterium]|nr:MAG: hypothetical protein E3J72_19425 [Planctomycetota bacterium]
MEENGNPEIGGAMEVKEKESAAGDAGPGHNKDSTASNGNEAEKPAGEPRNENRNSADDAAVEKKVRKLSRIMSAKEGLSLEDSKKSVLEIIGDFSSRLDAVYRMKEALENDFQKSEETRRQLDMENQELKAKNVILENKVRQAGMLEEELAFLEEERDEKAEKARELEKKLVKLRSEHESLESESDSLKSMSVESNRRLAKLEASHTSAVLEKETLEKRFAESDSETRRVKEENNNLKEELVSCEKSFAGKAEKYENDIDVLRRINAEKKREIENRAAEEESLRKKMRELNVVKEDLENEVAKSRDAFESLKANLDSTLSKLAAANTNISGKESGIERRNRKIDALKNELKRVTADRSKQSKRAAKLADEVNSAKEEIKLLELKLVEVSGEVEALESEEEEYRNIIDKLRQEKSTLEGDLESTKKVLDEIHVAVIETNAKAKKKHTTE